MLDAIVQPHSKRVHQEAALELVLLLILPHQHEWPTSIQLGSHNGADHIRENLA
jgi:hypothetical protein